MSRLSHQYLVRLVTMLIISIVGFVFAPPQLEAKGQSEQGGLFLPLLSTQPKPKPIQEQMSIAIRGAEAGAWPMAGANLERTSWTPEEVRGNLKPLWYKPFEPYIPQRVQIIAAYDTLYISTASGLYALNAQDGAERWVYATALPLGHSPTIADGVAYVGGFDHKLHAINALTGSAIWTFEAGAGFQTNPIVVGGKVYAGNRDGNFYAIYTEGPNVGKLAWQYQTEGPILYSAAYKDGVVFFASNDSHAYALDSETGKLIWKSAKLPGAGFYSWWPVLYRDRVILSGSWNIRTDGPTLSQPSPSIYKKIGAYPNAETDPRGTLIGPLGEEPGDWVTGTVTIDASQALTMIERNPWHRTYLVLDRFTGEEREKAPVLWTGTSSGNRYPPVVGVDGVPYQQNSYLSSPSIAGGHISGWKIGTPYISVVSSDWGAVDEPHAFSSGGNLIYWNLCCDRQAGAFDITIPNTSFASTRNSSEIASDGDSDKKREWIYFSYNTGIGDSLEEMLPGYNIQYYNPDSKYTSPVASFGGPNGVYGFHGDTNPPIPYRDRIYMHRSNSIIALGHTTESPIVLPMATTVPASTVVINPPDVADLQTRLARQVQKILDAGHLRPGYAYPVAGSGNFCGDDLQDYWHNSADTIYTLLGALPHLPADVQQRAQDYLRAELQEYPPYKYNHIGWRDGAARELFDLPNDVATDMANYLPTHVNNAFRTNGGWKGQGVWGLNPYSFYALWRYAELFGDAQTLLDLSQKAFWTEFNGQPTDEVLVSMPFVHNAYIAGYLGYLRLEQLAGNQGSSQVDEELARLMHLRAITFTKDTAYASAAKRQDGSYCRSLTISSNFMYMVPELAAYLHDNALSKVQAALEEYYRVAPYWFVTFAAEGFAENAIVPLYDSHSIFMAKALILREPGEELVKYLDVPGFARGDLFYIQKLVAAIENYDLSAPAPGPTSEWRLYIPHAETQASEGGEQAPAPEEPIPEPEEPFSTMRRIYMPYSDGSLNLDQATIAWLGQVKPTTNYADVRVLYTDELLKVHVNVVDSRLWYEPTPVAEQLESWDAVSLLLDRSGNPDASITSASYRFVAQLSHGQERQSFQAVYQGDGASWTSSSVAFVTSTTWRGSGLNDGADARGWSATFEIPFASFGLSAPPPAGTEWAMAVRVHDRDDATGTPNSIQSWPPSVDAQRSSTWGKLTFGLPTYTPPIVTATDVVTVQHGFDDVEVIDAHVGGHATCGSGFGPDFFDDWGDANYAGFGQVNIQNQWDVADFPCFSKYYVTFPLQGLPPDKAIISATLTLHLFGTAGGGNYTPEPGPSLIQVLTIDEDWQENSITWNNAPLAVQNVSAAWVSPIAPDVPELPFTWDVSLAVADAYASGGPLRLVLYSADLPKHTGKYFWSSDVKEWNATKRPALEITWGEPMS